jgi:lipoprotein-releasing system permease protein
MYKLLLILKYLCRKLAPMFAALAVTLCTAMVIIVISVMGGFLSMLKDSAKELTGDVIVGTNGYTGFPHYEDLISRLEEQSSIDLATPVVSSFGLLRIADQSVPVRLMGVRAKELDKVVRYRKSLYWDTNKYFNYTKPSKQNPDSAPTTQPSGADELADRWQLIESGMTFKPSKPLQQLTEGQPRPGLVLGIEANPVANKRDSQGNYKPTHSAIGRAATLTVVPVSQQGAVTDTALRRVQIVNEFKSGLHEIDARRVYMDFSLLQQMLHMDPAEKVNPQTGEPTGAQTPGRANQVLAKAAPGYTPEQARAAAQDVVSTMLADHTDMPLMGAQTWQERHGTLLSAVQNEKNLVTFLFGIISVVAVVMVAQTFYMIVLEKTRDIGVLRAMGASKIGILNLYLGYGLAIGIVGALVGLAIAWGIVTNLNQIQDLIAQWTGWRMWDPKVYVFDKIPDEVDWVESAAICGGAVLASVVGALIPALLAARLNPVEAIRHE